ncbi:hypothetical protein [Winogradskyella sp.]|uniref:hypothetical protein n=1 Tax=Winogradskyella sp. TaxID=1883156 RepID=UPI0025E15ACC|nr:hypothetical protein [Winogradskyella sp.]MBT8245288.1 hypothetical protein [Winogradskyella sp.]
MNIKALKLALTDKHQINNLGIENSEFTFEVEEQSDSTPIAFQKTHIVKVDVATFEYFLLKEDYVSSTYDMFHPEKGHTQEIINFEIESVIIDDEWIRWYILSEL